VELNVEENNIVKVVFKMKLRIIFNLLSRIFSQFFTKLFRREEDAESICLPWPTSGWTCWEVELLAE